MSVYPRIILILLSLFSIFGCQNQPQRNLENVELKDSELTALNSVIDKYNDNKLSKIIEIRDYNRKIKLFCTHQIVRVRKEPKPSRVFDVIAELYCGESSLKEGLDNNSGAYRNLFNLSSTPVRYLLTGDENGKFFVSTYELPRNLPYYKEDITRLFPKQELD